MFNPVPSSVSFPQLEQQILRFWKSQRIYEKSLDARRGCPEFVFYEGPPTANGMPHPGHCLTRAIKDLFPRYKTMRGYRCERKAGWDTHGLPVEVEVCKELGIHSKEEIERYGVEPFVRRCIESVFRYTREWEELTERLGFWIKLDEAYVTFHQSYVESVWWALKNLFDRGLLYQGHKIVWWWAQGGTALSSGEVGQGYRQVADPSVYVRLPLVYQPDHPLRRWMSSFAPVGTPLEDTQAAAGSASRDTQRTAAPSQQQAEQQSDIDLLVWTTTPWTLPSNQFAAVREDLDYALVAVEGQSRKLVLAAALVEQVAQKAGKRLTVVETFPGRAMIGWRYVPPLDYYYKTDGQRQGRLREGGKQHVAWRVVGAEFVTVDTGTGVVHQAPAFGEVDYDVLLAEQQRFVEGEGPELICGVEPDGTFSAVVADYKGRWVKDADRDIIRHLRQQGKLFHQEQYLHEYPFCWRAEEDPLIQYPRKSWFIRTTQFREAMLANNARINWLPEHIRDGRFGNFLESNVDWALSRERYWGTPLPIWVCEKTGYMEAVASYQELLAKPGVQGVEIWEAAKRANPELPDHLKVHKPYIDYVTYDSPKAPGARMRRVSEVIDCWFDSGAMPFAQWGFPHLPGSVERFASQFPADFISEAIDQTRGWFYSLLAISTLLFSREDQLLRKEDQPFRRENQLLRKAGQPSAGAQGKAADSQRASPSDVSGAGQSPSSAFASQQSAQADVRRLLARDYPHPFRNCIVLGLMLGEDGGKMSKSKRNYREPQEIFDRYGADALRWYFFSCQAPWTTIRYSEQAIKDCIPDFLLRLWNVYSFFVIYANIDGFDPAQRLKARSQHSGEYPSQQAGESTCASKLQVTPKEMAQADGYRPLPERCELDRWILSELNRTAAAVVAHMDGYDNFSAATRLSEFSDALSNWYVRRSRDRFWSSQQSVDKLDAYWTLYECLITTCKLIAPFVPFLAEAIWQNLACSVFGQRVVESVHLCDYPTASPSAIDELLSERMGLVREIVSLGRSARAAAKLKVRQPLSRVEVVLASKQHRQWLEEHHELICDELNVKAVEFIDKADKYITYTVLPDLKRLGPRLGKRLPELRKMLAQTDGARLLAELEQSGQVSLTLSDGPVTLDTQDVQVRLQTKPGWAAAQGRSCVVVLSTELTPELIAEGHARELVRVIQERRKEIGCDFTDRIALGIQTDSAELRAAAQQFAHYICRETLALEMHLGELPGAEPAKVDVSGMDVSLFVKVVQKGK